MTLKIYLKPDIEKFVALVEKSSGNVLLRLADRSLCNLKDVKMAADLLKQEADNCNGVEIHLSDTKDYFKFVSFMLGGCA